MSRYRAPDVAALPNIDDVLSIDECADDLADTSQRLFADHAAPRPDARVDVRREHPERKRPA
jgi:hypothetical protein